MPVTPVTETQFYFMSDQQLSEIKKIPIDGVKVGPRFRKDLGDIEGLAKSIEELGLLQPIVVSDTFQLIACQRRLEACKSLRWTEIPANIISLSDIIKGEFAENAMRQNFTPSEMVAIKRALEPLEKAQAEARQRAGIPSSESDGGRVDDRISAAIGVSRDTLRKAETVVKAAEAEPEKYEPIREAVDKGQMSINEGHRKVTGKSKKKTAQAKDSKWVPAALCDRLVEVAAHVKQAGEKGFFIRDDGHTVVSIGQEVEIST